MTAASVRVKICGITRAEDARLAAESGADAIGLNLVAGPRRIDVDRALQLLANSPESVEAWLLADVSGGDLHESLLPLTETGRIRRVQMYGAVTTDALRRLASRGLETVAVRHVADATFAATTSEWLEQVRPERPGLILLDAAGPRLGGTGHRIDWTQIEKARSGGLLSGWPPIVLAGGLTPDNVVDAIRLIRPAWVDVSSGVESAPGIKDAAKVRAFVEAIARQTPTPGT